MSKSKAVKRFNNSVRAIIENGEFYFVYMMYCKKLDAIKVGYSRDVKKRLSTVNVSSPYKVELASVLGCFETKKDAIEFESRIQLNLCTFMDNSNGEWFVPNEKTKLRKNPMIDMIIGRVLKRKESYGDYEFVPKAIKSKNGYLSWFHDIGKERYLWYLAGVANNRAIVTPRSSKNIVHDWLESLRFSCLGKLLILNDINDALLILSEYDMIIETDWIRDTEPDFLYRLCVCDLKCVSAIIRMIESFHDGLLDNYEIEYEY